MAGAPPMPMAPPMGNTAPASMTTQNLGQRAKGLATIAVAVKALAESIPELGAETEEGQAVLDAVKKLSKYAAPVSPDVTSQEMKLMAANTPAVPSPSIPAPPMAA